MKIYFDGSCGPKNPGGKACYGYVIFDGDKEIHRDRGLECEGEGATNNVAEYAGLYHGLKYLVESGQTSLIEIIGDSQLVINQVNKTWKCKKEHLQEYLAKVHKLLDSFDNWSAKWVPREENSEADTLSKVTDKD